MYIISSVWWEVEAVSGNKAPETVFCSTKRKHLHIPKIYKYQAQHMQSVLHSVGAIV